MVPGKLRVDSDGRVDGDIVIAYNNPWPCVNGEYGSGAMNGVVMHTMVGNLPGTVTVFNEPAYEASAHFGIAQDGSVHQFGPIGRGWVAWAEEAGNFAWYSIEHADDGDPSNPLTDAQIASSAQLFECLSSFAGFPLQVTDSVTGTGYGTHVMGGADWGNHSCPGPGPRAGQRHAIVALAAEIRKGAPVTPPDPGEVSVTSDGTLSLAALGTVHRTRPSSVLRRTAIHDGEFAAGFSNYIDAVFAASELDVPAGLVLRFPAS
jgi:N-acetylmuramoyl-L-alanine amidase-like protein